MFSPAEQIQPNINGRRQLAVSWSYDIDISENGLHVVVFHSQNLGRKPQGKVKVCFCA